MVTCYLGIGSNFGDRQSNIKSAIKRVNSLKETRVIKSSKVIETEPEAGPLGQKRFLNAVLKIRTGLSAFGLLKKVKKIEKKLGRKKTARNWPRPIDLDILLYSDRIIKSRQLQVPHPRMFARDFVLKPLLEVI